MSFLKNLWSRLDPWHRVDPPHGRFLKMKSRVDPSVLAESFAGAVSLAARELADQMEHVVQPHEAWPAELRSATTDATLTSVKFVLDVTERIASAHLSPAERELFWLTVERLTWEDDQQVTAACRITRRITPRLELLGQPEGATVGGTLLWELAKGVCRRYRDMNPAVATILSLVAANTVEVLSSSAAEHYAERQTQCDRDTLWGTRSRGRRAPADAALPDRLLAHMSKIGVRTDRPH